MTNKPCRCNYCQKPATVWLQYRGYISRPGRQAQRPLITVSTCEEHSGSENFQHHLKRNPDAVVSRECAR